MRVCLLASGSKGNAVFLESGESRILIDAGLSAREITSRLDVIDACGDELDALFVTHEHSDHCRGVGPLARRFALPVYLHPDTHRALPSLGRIDELRNFEAGDTISFRDCQLETFPLTHDAVAPVGYTVETSEGKVGIVTDLGIATRLVVERLKGCRVLIIESNHDEDLLRDGPYPWYLKQRVRSNHGHLSNNASAHLLKELLWEGLGAVFLAHLSETNNRPALAENAALGVLSRQNVCQPELIIGSQDRPSLCFTV